MGKVIVTDKRKAAWSDQYDLGRESANTRPAIIIGERRAGGTLMACCLSNHPEIFCDRWEPLNSGSLWYRMFPGDVGRLHLLLHQPYYKVSMCKLLPQHTWRKPVARYLKRHRPPVRMIHVYRENILAQAVSCVINLHSRKYKMGHPTHVFEPTELAPVKLIPADVVAWCVASFNHHRRATKWANRMQLPILPVSYEAMTGNIDTGQLPDNLSRRICEFLRVSDEPLYTRMHKVHVPELSEVVANWPEVVEAVAQSDYAKYLEMK